MKIALLFALAAQSAYGLNLLETLQNEPSASGLIQLLTQTGLLAQLQPELVNGTSNYTIFVPTNNALQDFEQSTATMNGQAVNNLDASATDVVTSTVEPIPSAAPTNSPSSSNQTYLTGLLTYHVLPNVFVPTGAGRYIVETLLKASGKDLNNLGNGKGQSLLVNVYNQTANHSEPAVSSSTDPNSSNLRFANGQELTVRLNRQVNVTKTLVADNGVIYLIDAVLVPPKSVSETAKKSGLFTKLLGALDQTNLTSVVDSAKGITVFAPTDAAFNALNITKDTNVANVLKYHVLPQILYTTNLTAGQNVSAPTLLGGPLSISFTNGKVYVKGTNNPAPIPVILSDVLTDNGVIHVIDSVLLPSEKDVVNPQGNTQSSGFMVKSSFFALISLAMYFL